jgi:hypothetical protein
MAAQKGSLIIADIGGYTSYLTSVELEHSHDVLADLVNTVVGTLSSMFRLAKLEGDAVFCYDFEEAPSGPSLIAAIEGTYFAFRRRLRDIAHLTTCQCNACIRIPSLDLKFVAHHGEFIVHEVAGRAELLGPDVITVHRLLKNTIVETTGSRAYAFLTDASIDSCTLDPGLMDLTPHIETYDDVGVVSGYLLDLGARWQAEEDRTAITVGPDDADLSLEIDVRMGAPALWDLMTSPHRAYEWFVGLESMTEENPAGIRGVGTVNHCVHGGMAVDQEIVDWKPFHYWTQRSATPMGALIMTTWLDPADAGTRIAYRMRFETPLPEEMRPMVIDMLTQQMTTNGESLKRVAESA